MRRLASVFSSKNNGPRSKIRTSQPPPSSFTSTPALSPTVPSQSSDASSHRSSLRTPEEEATTERKTSIKSIKSWIRRKSSNLKTEEQVPPSPLPSSRAVDKRHVQAASETLSDDDGDDDYHYETQPSSSKAHRNLTILLIESLHQHVSSPPLAHVPPSPPFPRSCTPIHSYPSPPTLRSTMHNTRLLQKLRDSSLSSSEQTSILPFSSRDYHPRPEPLQLSPYDENAPDFDRVTVCCRGLQRWIARPCFEDRYVVWYPDGCRAVSGSGFAVLELEYSEALEILAGFGFAEQQDPTVMITVAHEAELVVSPSEEPASAPAPAPPRHSLYVSTPSPLRMQHVPSSVPAPPPPGALDLPPKALSAPPPPPAKSKLPLDPKKGVRFEEGGKDDIPLGFVQRAKKNREDKAHFLREEQARRAYDLELARQNAQRARLDKERIEREATRDQERAIWEKERKAWEKEKKAMDEEKKAHLYAQELATSRARREASRAGAMDTSSSSSSLSEFGKLHPGAARINYTRKEYDSFGRRTGPEANANVMSSSRRHSATPPSGDSGSPDSSRPPSIGGGPIPSGSRDSLAMRGSRSRPVSYSSAHGHAAEDSNHTRESSSASKKRASFVSLPGTRPGSERSSTMPSGYMFIPPIPQVPMYMMDMPLLPPAPPFMMGQYPRSRSNESLGRQSKSSSPARPSGSSERVNQMASSPSKHNGLTMSTKQTGSRERGSLPSSPKQKSTSASASPHRHSYQSQDRRSSLDARPSMPQSQSQPNTLSRGRATMPMAYQAQAQAQAMAMAYQAQQFQAVQMMQAAAQASSSPSAYMQGPSPWTALPTASQVMNATSSRSSMMPMNGMVVTGRGSVGHSGGRRQATIS